MMALIPAVILGMLLSAEGSELYYTNRTFTPVTINVPGTPPLVDQMYAESGKLTDLVKGTNITVKTNANETYAIEKQAAIPICYGSSISAWNAALAYNGTPSNYPGKIFDNVGWVRGTKSVNGGWGAYLWVLQNKIVFKSSETNWWTSPSNGVRVAISNVLVGSLGDYPPMADTNNMGPYLDAATNNYPGENQSESKEFRVDITNVYYRLVIPSIWITPRSAYAAVNGSNVEFNVTGTNIPQGVTWSISPTDFVGHAEFYVATSNYASVTPGTVATTYTVRATSIDNTNFYDQVSLGVIKVDSVDPHSSDTNTHKIASNLGTHSNHFVCVKDTGDIILDATITPTNAADAITWEADGATITFPAVSSDKTTAKLPSATSQKIPVRIKVGSSTCWSGTVWVAWSSLAGDTNDVSTLNALSLGLAHGRAADRYNVAGGIEWIATITPSALITDTDRPAVETQTRVAPPGTDSGVAGPGNNDATGRAFAGWDFSRQIRQQFEKGNPLKPGEPMTPTTSSDPIPLHQPQSLPVSLVEGNDDKLVDDEDDDPYDGPSSGAGQKGTLRADDRPADYLIDDRDYNDVVPGEDGDSIRGRIQFREFIRVQLGTTWYRVSPTNDGLWRLHFDLQRTNGVYQLWPGTTPQFEMDNANYNIP